METYNELLQLLKAEIKPALGCTEPAAVAFTVAAARELLGGPVARLQVSLSSNVYKNALAVSIPGTAETGPVMAAALGAVTGESARELKIFDGLKPKDIEHARELLTTGQVDVRLAEGKDLYIEARVEGQAGTAVVAVSGGHTDIVKKVLNGVTVFEKPGASDSLFERVNLRQYKLADFIKIAAEVPFSEIAFLEEGIDMNMRIAEHGLELGSGLGVGAGLHAMLEKDSLRADWVWKVRIAVAAACDARMSGVELPVMSTMGSGNQGLVASVPVIVVSREVDAGKEKTVRALALSHLVTAYVKQNTGRLSPMCGAVVAGAGAAAAITWLLGGDARQVAGAVQNMIGNLAGMICDGAKGGCALKLATSGAEAVLMAQLALAGVIIKASDGIISSAAEDSVQNLAKLSKDGMMTMDRVILDIMREKR